MVASATRKDHLVHAQWEAQMNRQIQLSTHAKLPLQPPPTAVQSEIQLRAAQMQFCENMIQHIAQAQRPLWHWPPPTSNRPLPKEFVRDQAPPMIGAAQPPPPLAAQPNTDNTGTSTTSSTSSSTTAHQSHTSETYAEASTTTTCARGIRPQASQVQSRQNSRDQLAHSHQDSRHTQL